MALPKSTTELRRFMGMVNQLGKFSPRNAELSKPMREFLTVLALYDPEADTKISADASSHGLGGVLLQKNQQEWRSVAYAS